jgi:hypothetical protein
MIEMPLKFPYMRKLYVLFVAIFYISKVSTM